ncbi:MAG: acyl carrier protein [Pseudomonadota bacterium]
MEGSGCIASKFPEITDRLREKLEGLSDEAESAYYTFRSNGDPAMLDRAIIGAIRFFMPAGGEAGAIPDSAHLINDLGFDSIAMTELVFLSEDIFGIIIADDEVMTLTTVAEVKAFMRQKLNLEA